MAVIIAPRIKRHDKEVGLESVGLLELVSLEPDDGARSGKCGEDFVA